MAEEKTPPSPQSDEAPTKPAAAKAVPAADAAPKAKKEKPPAVEDKPFADFIEQHFVPELSQALNEEGWEAIQLKLEKSALAVQGADTGESYWQVRGQAPKGGDRQFSIVFSKEDISSPKFFYYTQGGIPSSTLEQFMGDERKITLDLLVLYTLQRLNGQKWLTRN
jgi:hypothetical protein